MKNVVNSVEIKSADLKDKASRKTVKNQRTLFIQLILIIRSSFCVFKCQV